MNVKEINILFQIGVTSLLMVEGLVFDIIITYFKKLVVGRMSLLGNNTLRLIAMARQKLCYFITLYDVVYFRVKSEFSPGKNLIRIEKKTT